MVQLKYAEFKHFEELSEEITYDFMRILCSKQ